MGRLLTVVGLDGFLQARRNKIVVVPAHRVHGNGILDKVPLVRRRVVDIAGAAVSARLQVVKTLGRGADTLPAAGEQVLVLLILAGNFLLEYLVAHELGDPSGVIVG